MCVWNVLFLQYSAQTSSFIPTKTKKKPHAKTNIILKSCLQKSKK